jgi:cytochrome P450
MVWQAGLCIEFGAPHFCPGVALTRLWLAGALAGFFEAFPKARLAGRLEWQPGTLLVPREIVLTLH